MEPILLTHWRAPGDIVCMTACVRDLALNYPNRYEIHVAGSCQDLWENNPHVTKAWGPRLPRDIPRYRLSCVDSFATSDTSKMHYITAFHRDLEKQLAIEIPALYPKGDLYLSDPEGTVPPVEGRYWLVIAGGKADIPVKMWSAARFQQIVSILHEHDIRCVQAGATLPGHQHPVLSGVIDLVGKTDFRGFLRLVYHADGVICPPTFAMHAAAAFDKPCVVIAGGREPWWWAAYVDATQGHFGEQSQPVQVPHRYLHTIGQLECCRLSGCWRTHIGPCEGKSTETLCVSPVDDGHGQSIPTCLAQITVEQVIEAVLSYNGDGDLDSDCQQESEEGHEPTQGYSRR